LSAVLGFDTATDDVAVAVLRGGEVLYESLRGPAENGGPVHARALLGEVEAAVAAAGGWDSIERIAVGAGPGSFTGIRVGIASARGLGFSRGLPVTGACTLDALARGMTDAAGERDRLVVSDARRGEVFAALYAADGERLWGPSVSSPEALAGRIAESERAALGAGSGAVRFRQQLASRSVDVPDDADPMHRVAARHVCALVTARAGDGRSDSVAPIYLRPPDAERWRERGTDRKAK
jgi:tRNA threonylcarbamoyladenosine biosynthesis protein TsaB